MYTVEALLDVHERAHRSLQRLLAHCQQFDADELNRELSGFGYPTIREQLYHVIAAEEYWVGVLKGDFDAEDHEEACPTIESLESYRNQVAETTAEYLRSATEEDLNTARRMLTWQNKERILMPAHVVMRPLTHIFQHQGQILAMCRLMGKPAAGLDFPIA